MCKISYKKCHDCEFSEFIDKSTLTQLSVVLVCKVLNKSIKLSKCIKEDKND